MESALAVANYFIKKGQNRTDLTHMKLQKLVYFAHGWFLAFTDQPLINESVEAWKYGPVIPSIYSAFKSYGNDKIKKPQADYWGEIPEVKDGNVIDILDLVWELYSDLTPIQLSNLTHQTDSPWYQTLKDYLEKGREIPRGKDIDEGLIKAHFATKLTLV